MSELLIVSFLFASLVLYLIFGGADYGAGMVEFWAPTKYRQRIENLTYKAIGPVWEANHMWLVLSVVILFVAYPRAYAVISTALHWPITALLMGIIGRGSAFSFRHYDAQQDRSQYYYSRLFILSSFWAPFWLGVIAAAAGQGRIPSAPTSFYEGYIGSWLGVFPVLVGLFTCALCMTLAAVYLIGEIDVGGRENRGFDSFEDISPEELKKYFRQIGFRANIVAVILGLSVFVLAEISGFPLVHRFVDSPLALVAILGATICFGLTIALIKGDNFAAMRVFVAGEVVFVLGGWLSMIYPNLIFFADAGPISAITDIAPEATQRVLLIALFVGSAIIFPFLGFLLWVFKK